MAKVIAGSIWYVRKHGQQLLHTYEICGTAYGDHTPVLVTRTIDPYLYLRPIPQGQLDGMEMTADEKAAYQNPGY